MDKPFLPGSPKQQSVLFFLFSQTGTVAVDAVKRTQLNTYKNKSDINNQSNMTRYSNSSICVNFTVHPENKNNAFTFKGPLLEKQNK